MHTRLQLRLDEIRFVTIITNYFNKDSDPNRLYDFMEFLSQFFGVSSTLVASAMVDVINNPYYYRPLKFEMALLLTEEGWAVRKICRELKLGHSTYYTYIKTYQEEIHTISPKLTLEKVQEVSKVIKGIEHLLEVIV